MTQFEYQIEDYVVEPSRPDTKATVTSAMNAMGAQGWELVSWTTLANNSKYRAVYKRETPKVAEEGPKPILG